MSIYTYIKKLTIVTCSLCILNTYTAHAAPLDDILKQVKQSNIVETNIDNEALLRFKNNFATQKTNLLKQQERSKALQLKMEMLQNSITNNNKDILAKQKLASSEKSDLDKIFDEFKRASQDLRGQLKKSPLSASLPGRASQLSPYSEADFEPNLAAMKKLWLMFTEQMVVSSKITTREQIITMADGSKKPLIVTQVAGFSAFSAQGALQYQPNNESYQLLTPTSKDIAERIAMFTHNEDGFFNTLIDPTSGALFARSTQTTAWWKVFSDAGFVGAIIVVVGVIGIVIALFRLLILNREAKRIQRQKIQQDPTENNALGRIITVADKHLRSNADELTRFLDEAILAELPEFRKGLGSLAVLATIAPLLGLLGTVAGMIETFHAITAYGNSDPQVLSSGISKALLTTKFGLIAAVPLLLLHSLLSSKSNTILNIIEHQTAGLLAQRQQRLNEGHHETNSSTLDKQAATPNSL